MKPSFRIGTSINDLAEALRNGTVSPNDIPPIRIVEHDGQLFSLDNRRLLAFRLADGIEIPFRLATNAEISKEWVRKFTTDDNGKSIRMRGLQ